VKFGIYWGIYGIYMPVKFGHPQCPNVGDFGGLKNRTHCATLHDEIETGVFNYSNWPWPVGKQ